MRRGGLRRVPHLRIKNFGISRIHLDAFNDFLDVSATIIYIHVLDKIGYGVRSHIDGR
jgi:hypothetical protein